jgi:hypothetical protein
MKFEHTGHEGWGDKISSFVRDAFKFERMGCGGLILVFAILGAIYGAITDLLGLPKDRPEVKSYTRKVAVDFDRPIFGKGNLRGTLYGCIDPADFRYLTASDMGEMDDGGTFRTCRALLADKRLRVVERQSIYVRVLPYHIPPGDEAGMDLWVFDSDLKN